MKKKHQYFNSRTKEKRQLTGKKRRNEHENSDDSDDECKLYNFRHTPTKKTARNENTTSDDSEEEPLIKLKCSPRTHSSDKKTANEKTSDDSGKNSNSRKAKNMQQTPECKLYNFRSPKKAARNENTTSDDSEVEPLINLKCSPRTHSSGKKTSNENTTSDVSGKNSNSRKAHQEPLINMQQTLRKNENINDHDSDEEVLINVRNSSREEEASDSDREVTINLQHSSRKKTADENTISDDDSDKENVHNLQHSSRKKTTNKYEVGIKDVKVVLNSTFSLKKLSKNKSPKYENSLNEESPCASKKMHQNKNTYSNDDSEDETLAKLEHSLRKKHNETSSTNYSDEKTVYNSSDSSRKNVSCKNKNSLNDKKKKSNLKYTLISRKSDSEETPCFVSDSDEQMVSHAAQKKHGNVNEGYIDGIKENKLSNVKEVKDMSEAEDEHSDGDAKIEVIVENVVRARVLTSDVLDGQSIFGFVTPKRKDALAKIAQEAVQSNKKSSKKLSLKSSSKKKRNNYKAEDPDDKKIDSNEGASRKMKNRITLALTLAANASDNSEEEWDGTSDDDVESDDSTSPKKTKEHRDLLDEYFEVHSKSIAVTSDKTLTKLKNPKMDQKELLNHLKEMQSSHAKETLRLHSVHNCHFDKWMFQLLSGFNVLLYGLGSKHSLLEKFRKDALKDKVHIVVNGFFPSIILKQILKTITNDILQGETHFKNNIEHYKYIKTVFDSGTAGELYIIVHNIDGHTLRSQNVQSALGHIASSSNVHVIASIDHINAPLTWDQNRASAFNWLWYDVTTFESYAEETSYENSLMVQQSGTLALSSLKHVLHSLTSNAKGIFKFLTDYHLDNEDNSSYQGISFTDLYTRCRERFLVNSDLTLRAQLTEFKDHKLIKTKKGFDGVEYLSVALDCATLRMYLEGED